MANQLHVPNLGYQADSPWRIMLTSPIQTMTQTTLGATESDDREMPRTFRANRRWRIPAWTARGVAQSRRVRHPGNHHHDVLMANQLHVPNLGYQADSPWRMVGSEHEQQKATTGKCQEPSAPIGVGEFPRGPPEGEPPS
jgi:2-succinyl-5-enolpyruvyl-6-hydroxy-3-cyclohexene-1-carboxylate synthase